MKIQQFEDKNLAHYSYAILSNNKIALIDPSRNPEQYYNFAVENNAKITCVIETHPHADFVSSHLEIHKATGAKIFVSKLLGAEYAHETFDDGDTIQLGKITLKAINTPGHSPDSISIIAVNENGVDNAIFTGDTLFIGDCGRPDLREQAGAITATRENLAKQMYHSLKNKILPLGDQVLVYPAHGAGSLCGKALSTQNHSTIGAEKIGNWSLQEMTEAKFVQELLSDQPFIPKYFPVDVAINKKGAENYKYSINKVSKKDPITCQACANELNPDITIIDTRPQIAFKKAHFKDAINLMDDTKFETWLGSVINPDEKFYLIAENDNKLDELIARIAKIGYETNIESAFVSEYGNTNMDTFENNEFKNRQQDYTIIDIRNQSEANANKIFSNAIHIPLHELRERTNEIPTHKTIVVHCAGGYRSAAGSSLIKSKLKNITKVYDLSEKVKEFQP